MGLLADFGLTKKSVPKTATQISLHPDCRQRHSSVIASWFLGIPVEVLNPETNEWEPCAEPIFDPAYDYRCTPMSAPVHVPKAAPAPVAPPAYVPAPPTSVVDTLQSYERGDIFCANNGNTYLVLGNKYNIIDGYIPDEDPDSGHIVVMRFDTGRKQAVTCRDEYGNRPHFSEDFTLTRKIDSCPLLLPTYSQGKYKLYQRNNGTMVYLDPDTGEVTFS